LYTPRYTFSKLLHAKMFLGGARNLWNPEIVPYLSGSRNKLCIIDLTNTSFRLRKFLSYVELISQRRARVLFILRPAFAPLAELIYPLADYYERYIGGAVSNFRSVRRHLPYRHGKLQTYDTNYTYKYPSAMVLFSDHTRHTDFMVNESLCTRTPSALLSDALGFSHVAPYHIPATSDLGAARLMVNYVLAAIKRGQRREKLHLRRCLRILAKKTMIITLKKSLPTYLRPEGILDQVQLSSFLAARPNSRFAMIRLYIKNSLRLLYPVSLQEQPFRKQIHLIEQTKKFLSIAVALKPIIAYRLAISLAFKFTKLLPLHHYTPLLRRRNLYINRSEKQAMKYELKRKKRLEAKQKNRIIKDKAQANLVRNSSIKKIIETPKNKQTKLLNNMFSKTLRNPIKRSRVKLELIKHLGSHSKFKQQYNSLRFKGSLRKKTYRGKSNRI
jgi:hypothetical protein